MTGRDWAQAAPSLEEISALAEAARQALPEPFSGPAAALLLRVTDWPDDATLDEMGIEDPYELTGLYRGIALTQRSVEDVGGMPDEVWLFRRPILDEWAARGDVALSRLVAHVLVHEIAHHFGWSDADIAAVDDWRL
ncbi:MAG: metallopeptidase family protein [Pikeienuella sp.]